MNFAFGINVIRGEENALRQSVEFLRRAYPTAPIVILCDGCPADTFNFIHADLNSYIVEGPRLRLHPTGGQWLQRWLSSLIDFHTDYIVKLDPDTRIMRKLSQFPDADMFGYLRMRTDKRSIPIKQSTFITAAFVAIKHRAAKKLFESGELLKDVYTDDFYSYASHGLMRDSDNLAIGSWILTDAAQAQGLTIARSEEIYLRWRSSVPADLWDQYAVVNVETFKERKQS